MASPIQDAALRPVVHDAAVQRGIRCDPPSRHVVTESMPNPEPDMMDLEFDLDYLSWETELDHSFAHTTDMHLDFRGAPEQYNRPGHEAAIGYPSDFLFLEDEETFPNFFDGGLTADDTSMNTIRAIGLGLIGHETGPGHEMGSTNVRLHEQSADDHDSRRLRSQLSLLSAGSYGDELVFKACERSKAIALHNLAIEYGLGYNHNVTSRTVSISRITTSHLTDRYTNTVRPPDVTPPEANTARPPSTSRRQLVSAVGDSHLPSFSSSEAEMQVPNSSLFEAFIPLLTDIDGEYTPVDARGSAPVTSYAGQRDERTPTTLTQPASSDESQPITRSRSQRISNSISKHVSTWKTSMSKGGRRGPLTENGRRDMKALEEVNGACWRCKVLRRKCDPGTPCRCCLQSIPTPHVGDDAPLWPLIGCRRGPIRLSMTAQLLCPKSRRTCPEQLHQKSCGGRRSLDISDRCFLSAESQRLSDMKAVLEGASYKLSIADPNMRDCFASFVEAGRYRNQDSLHKGRNGHDNAVTYAELIATVAWELAENQTSLQLLEIRSWDQFMAMLETACLYEAEVGQTSLVMLSMVCLRHCLGALRLNSANLLSVDAHNNCQAHECQVHYIHDLGLHIKGYIDELSSVIFNKENMRDRRWWLSTFFSLYIQSYIRHALATIEKQLCFPAVDDVPAEDLTSTQYLHLVAMLFTAASAKYDPLLGGRQQYALTDNSVIPEATIPEPHQSSARAACEIDKWPEAGIKNPYQFLRRLFQIGSLDFELEQVDVQMPDVSTRLGEPNTPLSPPGWNQGIPSSRRLESPRLNRRFTPHSPSAHFKRDSINSHHSLASFASGPSNTSSISLTKSFDTDITSIYESLYESPISAPDQRSSFQPTKVSIREGHYTSFHDRNSVTASQTQRIETGSPAMEDEGARPEASASCFVCDCCPKSPRLFHSSEELIKHESEKPYPCSQCKKRFKGPKEAERHINAIHLKSDYWSCQALTDTNMAYHSEEYPHVAWDICGFCGGVFLRNADGSPNTDELASHLELVHKYKDCKQNKKFYRVDNFRQHLKTAHGARLGKWLKVLEKNCRTATAQPDAAGA
ncbi:hypothetical protein B0T22DRAFT_63249 [Podospora appendiculata]|uniref:C2H2-type domain-containing protein n=1 Tax=Podospora appendiculata TaxID=314037 RepID=A0AAE1CH52_9PEZI|nr:hypothetical protein B0T22DRAFT_63249 [Podospora appendiculata]